MIYRELADEGSVWPMELTAQCFDLGRGTPVNPEFAQEYYLRAIAAGSQMATIKYAILSEKIGRYEEGLRVLERGIETDFVPAYFRTASLRLKHSRSRKTHREIRPLLEYAADKGHPLAQFRLARMMAFGKFGFRDILRGCRLSYEFMSGEIREPESGSAADKTDSA